MRNPEHLESALSNLSSLPEVAAAPQLLGQLTTVSSWSPPRTHTLQVLPYESGIGFSELGAFYLHWTKFSYLFFSSLLSSHGIRS